jgi:hypothetical protein
LSHHPGSIGVCMSSETRRLVNFLVDIQIWQQKVQRSGWKSPLPWNPAQSQAFASLPIHHHTLHLFLWRGKFRIKRKKKVTYMPRGILYILEKE